MGNEIWKEVLGTEGQIIVSNLGNVKRKNEGYFKPAHISMSVGYFCVSIGKGKAKMIHRLVAETFIPNPEGKRCVNHINSIIKDNRVENLEWCTHSENSKHAVKLGRMTNNHIKKKVGCFSKNNNILLAEYDSLTKASKEMDITISALHLRIKKGIIKNGIFFKFI